MAVRFEGGAHLDEGEPRRDAPSFQVGLEEVSIFLQTLWGHRSAPAVFCEIGGADEVADLEAKGWSASSLRPLPSALAELSAINAPAADSTMPFGSLDCTYEGRSLWLRR